MADEKEDAAKQATEKFNNLVAATIALFVAMDNSTEQLLMVMRARGGMDLFGSDFDALLRSLISDGRWNAWAAAAAALAAGLQGIAVVLEWNRSG